MAKFRRCLPPEPDQYSEYGSKQLKSFFLLVMSGTGNCVKRLRSGSKVGQISGSGSEFFVLGSTQLLLPDKRSSTGLVSYLWVEAGQVEALSSLDCNQGGEGHSTIVYINKQCTQTTEPGLSSNLHPPPLTHP